MTAPMSGGYSGGSVAGGSVAGGSVAGSTAATGTDTSSESSEASVGQLLGAVTQDLSTLMRQELELAKAELRVEAKKAGQAAGMFGAAAFAGYFVVLFLSTALWRMLDNWMDSGLAALLVAVLWGIVAAVAFVMGRAKAREVNPTPERTVETAKQVPDALKPNTSSHAEEIR